MTQHLPVEVADHVDFHASEHRAANLGRLFRPDNPDPLTPNWKHLPVGYHGRSSSIVVSGTDIVGPCGQRKGKDDPAPVFGPSVRLDIEAELEFVVGTGTPWASPCPSRRPSGTCSGWSWSTTTASSPGPGGTHLGFGEARGRILPARSTAAYRT